MENLEIKCPAKINLSLDVIKKRDDGYHDVEMVMQTIPLYDIIRLEKQTATGIELSCSKPITDNPKDNIAYSAAKLFSDTLCLNVGVKIHIEKNIPQGAGMAGGSTDAAGVLVGLNKMFNSRLSQESLMSMGKALGSDVPFCILGNCSLAEGIGDVLTPVPPLKGVFYIIAKPEFSVSTPWVYKNLDLSQVISRPNTNKVIKSLTNCDLASLAIYSKNVLETVTIKRFPIIQEYKSRLLNLGAIHTLMSGSGPTVFGIFSDREKAENAYISMSELTNEVFLLAV